MGFSVKEFGKMAKESNDKNFTLISYSKQFN